MSRTYEWHENPAVEFLPAGYDIHTGEPANDDTPIERLTTAGGVLVISSDEAAVVHGNLSLFLRRVLSAMPITPEFQFRIRYKGTVMHGDTSPTLEEAQERIRNLVECIGGSTADYTIERRTVRTVVTEWAESR